MGLRINKLQFLMDLHRIFKCYIIFNMEKEILKLKIQSLVALRTNLINILIVLIGGIISLLFLPDYSFKYLLIILGVFYVLVFLSNLLSINNKLDKLLIVEKEI